MKVGIITFHNGSNYGAALQSFALQEVEKKLGNEVFLINYDNRFISKGLDRVRFGFSILGLYSCFIDLLNYKSNRRKIEKFKEFFRNYYSLTHLMNSDALKTTNFYFDLGISGSDQIWNPLLNKGVDDIYYLNFGSFRYKISYASSLGNYKFDNENFNDLIKRYLQSYLKVSTRESSDKLERLIGKKIFNVCDPTLLLSKEEWANSLGISENISPYILVYSLTDSDNVIKIAHLIAKKKNLKIINIGKAIYHYNDVRCVLDAGPKEFVELFYNASYVVTNSFHGTAFSINFKKQFVSVKHPKSPERAEHILSVTGLLSRLVSPHIIEFPNDMEESSIDDAMKALGKIRTESYQFLTESI